ncbi:MAG: hypothetical protein ACR2PG_25965 [Hyphomicrobiaceae bacterium]
MKRLFANLSLLIASVVFALLLLEGMLRFLPVNEGLRAQAVNTKQPIYRFKPNRVAQYSHRWDFDIRNAVRVNNYGFVSDQDYDPTSPSPLFAVIGDSYVEAQMVPFAESIAGRLQAKVKDKARVYAFAASGSGLAQHMAYAKYARDEFRPTAFAFVIIANDFVESLAHRNASNGFHRFVRDGATDWRMDLKEYEPSVLRRLLRNSKLAMYLMTNVKVHVKLNYAVGNAQLPFSLGGKDQGRRFVGNVDFHADQALWRDATWAAAIYLDNLPQWAGVRPDHIVFVVDGIRPQLYEKDGLEGVAGSFWARMREHFITEAKKRGYEVIDMQQRFIASYQKKKKRFEFPTDFHWNSEGHAAAAEAATGGEVWSRFRRNLNTENSNSGTGMRFR